MKKSNLLLLASLMALTVAGAANAQTAPAPAAPAAPTPPTFGAAIPGQCVLDEQSAVVTSKMGVGAATRMGQLKGAVQSELQGQAGNLQTEYQQLAAAQKTATTAQAKQQFETKAQAFAKKRDDFQAKAQQREQELQYTEQGAMQQVFAKMIPSINAVVTAKGCSTVISASSLLRTAPASDQQSPFTYVNPAMDITAAVVQKMDSTGELLPAFERISLDQPAPQQAAAAKPAAPKPAAPKPAAGAAPKK